jgi:hypothetical protein
MYGAIAFTVTFCADAAGSAPDQCHPVPCISSFGDLPAPARVVEMKAPAASGNRRDQKQH